METDIPQTDFGNSTEDRFGLLKTVLRWGVPAILLFVSLILGYLGFQEHAVSHGYDRSPLDLTYRVLQLFTLTSGGVEPPVPWTLEIARWTAPTLPVFAAILGLFNLLRRFSRSERVRLYRDHVIVCGAGLKGMTLARNLKASGMKVVVIEHDPNNLNLRLLERLGIPFFIGDATLPQNLRRARINQARHLVALCGEDQINVSVAVAVRGMWQGRTKGAITCHIDVNHGEACRALIERELHDSETPLCWLEFHKTDDIAAENLLLELEGLLRNRKGKGAPHILFAGLDSMGCSLLLKAARLWSEVKEPEESEMEFTVIGEGAGQTLETLFENHPPLEKWSRRENTLLSTNSLKALEEDIPAFDLAFVCAEGDAQSLSEALETHRILLDDSPEAPIFVPTYENQGFRKFLPGTEDDTGHFRAISVISILEKCFTPDYLEKGAIEDIARFIHLSYVEDWDPERDMSGAMTGPKPNRVDWLALSKDSRMANYGQARRIFEHLTAQGFRIDPSREWVFEPLVLDEEQVEILAIVEHDQWCSERRARGWKEGRRTDPGKFVDRVFPWRWKRHNCLVPWPELGTEEKETDRKMVRKWPVILKAAGFQIRPGHSDPFP